MSWAIAKWMRELAIMATEPKPAKSPPRIGKIAVHIARHEIGRGEVTANNKGPDIDRYRTSVVNGKMGPGGAWCAAFISYILELASETHGIVPPFKRSHGAKRLYKNLCVSGTMIGRRDMPFVGDIAVWHRGTRVNGMWGWQGHIGIVSELNWESKSWKYIAGNEGRFPSKVHEFRAKNLGKLAGFVRI